MLFCPNSKSTCGNANVLRCTMCQCTISYVLAPSVVYNVHKRTVGISQCTISYVLAPSVVYNVHKRTLGITTRTLRTRADDHVLISS